MATTQMMNPSVMNASEFRSPEAILPPISYATHTPSTSKLNPIKAWLRTVGIRRVVIDFLARFQERLSRPRLPLFGKHLLVEQNMRFNHTIHIESLHRTSARSFAQTQCEALFIDGPLHAHRQVFSVSRVKD